MSESSSGNPNKPPEYFNVERPAHFRVRGDLIEELCGGEAISRLLPRNEAQYRHWLTVTGNPAGGYPLIHFHEHVGKIYEPTLRYALHQAILPGYEHPVNILTDGRGWSGWVDYGGLFDFVLLRAVEFAESHGFSPPYPTENLFRKRESNAGSVALRANWFVGYERGSGLCTLLERGGDSETLFLAGRSGYWTPPFEEGDPIF